MPTYDYICQDCRKPFEVRMSITAYSQSATPACPACGSMSVVRAFSAVNVLTSSRGAGPSSDGRACSSGRFT
jgi:putative FmdB family regulatory protein